MASDSNASAPGDLPINSFQFVQIPQNPVTNLPLEEPWDLMSTIESFMKFQKDLELKSASLSTTYDQILQSEYSDLNAVNKAEGNLLLSSLQLNGPPKPTKIPSATKLMSEFSSSIQGASWKNAKDQKTFETNLKKELEKLIKQLSKGPQQASAEEQLKNQIALVVKGAKLDQIDQEKLTFKLEAIITALFPNPGELNFLDEVRGLIVSNYVNSLTDRLEQALSEEFETSLLNKIQAQIQADIPTSSSSSSSGQRGRQGRSSSSSSGPLSTSKFAGLGTKVLNLIGKAAYETVQSALSTGLKDSVSEILANAIFNLPEMQAATLANGIVNNAAFKEAVNLDKKAGNLKQSDFTPLLQKIESDPKEVVETGFEESLSQTVKGVFDDFWEQGAQGAVLSNAQATETNSYFANLVGDLLSYVPKYEKRVKQAMADVVKASQDITTAHVNLDVFLDNMNEFAGSGATNPVNSAQAAGWGQGSLAIIKKLIQADDVKTATKAKGGVLDIVGDAELNSVKLSAELARLNASGDRLTADSTGVTTSANALASQAQGEFQSSMAALTKSMKSYLGAQGDWMKANTQFQLDKSMALAEQAAINNTSDIRATTKLDGVIKQLNKSKQTP